MVYKIQHAGRHKTHAVWEGALVLRRRLFVYLLSPLFFLTGPFGCSSAPTGFFHFRPYDPADGILQQHFPQAVAFIDERGQVTCVLDTQPSGTGGPASGAVKQTLIVRSFWLPRRGRTLLSPSSTNVNIEYLIEADGRCAWYRGAGFATLRQTDSRGNFHLYLLSGQIRPDRRTIDFKPSFTAADVSGNAVVAHDPQTAAALLEAFDQKVQALKKSAR